MVSPMNSAFSAGSTYIPNFRRQVSTRLVAQDSASRIGSLKVCGLPRRSRRGSPSGRRFVPMRIGGPCRRTLPRVPTLPYIVKRRAISA